MNSQQQRISPLPRYQFFHHRDINFFIAAQSIFHRREVDFVIAAKSIFSSPRYQFFFAYCECTM
jgi:hypothetical protein